MAKITTKTTRITDSFGDFIEVAGDQLNFYEKSSDAVKFSWLTREIPDLIEFLQAVQKENAA